MEKACLSSGLLCFLQVRAYLSSEKVSLSSGRVCQGSEKVSLPFGLRCRAAGTCFCHGVLRVRRPDGLQCFTFDCFSRLGFEQMSRPFGVQRLTMSSQPLGDEDASCMIEDGALSVPHRRLRGCAVVFCCGAADHAPCQCGASASMPLLGQFTCKCTNPPV